MTSSSLSRYISQQHAYSSRGQSPVNVAASPSPLSAEVSPKASASRSVTGRQQSSPSGSYQHPASASTRDMRSPLITITDAQFVDDSTSQSPLSRSEVIPPTGGRSLAASPLSAATSDARLISTPAHRPTSPHRAPAVSDDDHLLRDLLDVDELERSLRASRQLRSSLQLSRQDLG
jgi:hypothetical protein